MNSEQLTNTNEGEINNGEIDETKIIRKKQKSQGYRKYIYDVLKSVYPKLGLMEHTRSSLNMFSKNMASIISDLARKNLLYTGRNTLSPKDIQIAMLLVFPRDLGLQAKSFATKHFTEFNTSMYHRSIQEKEDSDARKKPISHSSLAGLIFPVKRTLDIIRVKELVGGSGGSGLYRAGEGAGVYLAAVLEYLVREILAAAGREMANLDANIKNKKVLIKPRHLLLGINSTNDLRLLFKMNGFVIINSGINPNILKEILVKKRVTKRKKSPKVSPDKEEEEEMEEKDESGEVKKKHRFLPGTVTLRVIRKLQKSDDSILSKSPLNSFIRFIMERYYYDDAHFSAETLDIMREYIEIQTINVLRSANDITIVNKRLKMKSGDFNFARLIHFRDLPSFEGHIMMKVYQTVDKVRSLADKKLPPTKPEIRRMSLRAGCKYQTKEMNEMVYIFINDLVNQICMDASNIIILNKLKTVRPKDFLQALRARGIYLIY